MCFLILFLKEKVVFRSFLTDKSVADGGFSLRLSVNNAILNQMSCTLLWADIGSVFLRQPE